MNVGAQIKKYRSNLSMSQDMLAEKIFVSRQTISNWENDKSYPDINSLVLMSEIFNTSVDELIKGDVLKMKDKINGDNVKKFKKLSNLFTFMFVIMIIIPMPIIKFLKFYVAVIVLAVWFLATFYVGFLVEQKKEEYDLRTYKEIIAFTEGKTLTQEERDKEKKKAAFQKTFLPIAFAIVALIVSLVMMYILDLF